MTNHDLIQLDPYNFKSTECTSSNPKWKRINVDVDNSHVQTIRLFLPEPKTIAIICSLLIKDIYEYTRKFDLNPMQPADTAQLLLYITDRLGLTTSLALPVESRRDDGRRTSQVRDRPTQSRDVQPDRSRVQTTKKTPRRQSTKG